MNLLQNEILQRSDIWRGGDTAAASSVSSGFVALDALLPGGGFPLGALTEILVPRLGIGELRLVLPAITHVMQERWLAFVAPPYVPYAPALVRAGVDLSHTLVVHTRTRSDTLWATEQALRAGTCGAVLAWPTQAPMHLMAQRAWTGTVGNATAPHRTTDFKWLRRLQLAAEAGGAMGMLFVPAQRAASASPAALRLRLEAQADGLAVHVLKRRGGWPAGPVQLDWSTLRQGRRLRGPAVFNGVRLNTEREVSHAMALFQSPCIADGDIQPRQLRAG